MSYSSFPYALRLSPNKLHEYKQFYLQFFAYIFLAYSDYGFSHPCSCSCGNPSILLYSEPKEGFKNICRKSSLEYSGFVFTDAVTWHLFRRRKRKRSFSLLHVCVYFRENLMHTLISLSFYAVGVTSEEEVLCFREKSSILNFIWSGLKLKQLT